MHKFKKIYIAIDGTEFKSKKKVNKYNHKILKECCVFHYDNIIEDDDNGVEKFDFANYGINSKETFNAICRLFYRK